MRMTIAYEEIILEDDFKPLKSSLFSLSSLQLQQMTLLLASRRKLKPLNFLQFPATKLKNYLHMPFSFPSLIC